MACAMCLISSCSSDASDNVSKGCEVMFDVAGLSRATVTTHFDRFAVYGDMKFPVDNSTEPTVIFNKTEVEYKDGVWSYEGIRYWYPQHEHSFVAISPVEVLESAGAPRYSNSLLSFNYKIPMTADRKVSSHSDVTDIIAATHRRFYNKEDKTSTLFTFDHLMALINISPSLNDNIMNKEEYFKILSVEFSGFKTEATFNIFPASRQSNDQTDDRVIDVTGQDVEGQMTVEFPEPVKIFNNRENVRLFDDNDAIIMLPQTFGDNSEAKIILYYTINDETSVKNITIPLKNRIWESGKSYTYRFTFNRIGLVSEGTVISDWDVLNAGHMDVH